jgi:hypothetical protein
MTNIQKISDEEFERRFDAGEDISPYLDLASAKLVRPNAQRVNVDFPPWMVRAMDKEASRLGVSRQAFIKFVMDSHLQIAKTQHA